MSRSVIIETIDSLPDAQICGEIADFLARFVQDGGLASPLPGDDCPQTWLDRLNWWWQANPFVKPSLPLAWLLVDEENDRIVGFAGFIPHDYEVDGEMVPSLISTTLFVDSDFRNYSMKLILKLNKLGREFQILDGTPSPEMQVILNKFHYEHCEELRRYNIIVQARGVALKARLLKLTGLGKSIAKTDLPAGLKVITDPQEIRKIPDRSHDGVLRRSVSRDGLIWMANAGHGERCFFGLIDEETGELRAFTIGLLKSRRGVSACRMLEYGAFDADDSSLLALMSHIANRPEDAGLPGRVDLLLWSIFPDALQSEPDFEPEIRTSTLYFTLPKAWKSHPKSCLPSEGDFILL